MITPIQPYVRDETKITPTQAFLDSFCAKLMKLVTIFYVLEIMQNVINRNKQAHIHKKYKCFIISLLWSSAGWRY